MGMKVVTKCEHQSIRAWHTLAAALVLAAAMFPCFSLAFAGQDSQGHLGDPANFAACMKAKPCNHALLDRNQYAQLRKHQERANYESCMKGGNCDHTLLTKVQKEHVDDLGRKLDTPKL